VQFIYLQTVSRPVNVDRNNRQPQHANRRQIGLIIVQVNKTTSRLKSSNKGFLAEEAATRIVVKQLID